MDSKLVRTVALCACLVTFAAEAQAGPILWNRLGSDAEVQNSDFGPDLGFYAGGAPWPDVTGTPGYTPGVFGGALTLAPAGYGPQDRVHNVVWDNLHQSLDPDRGTIEVWYRQTASPVPFQHGVYRIFDGPYGLGSGMTFTVHQPTVAPPLLYFGLEFGGTPTEITYDVAPHNGTWVHLAGVWDRDGIDGSANKLRLYVNGQQVAAANLATWGNTVGQRADIGGGNDDLIAGKFALDNLKVYDHALTDFSHRFDESAIPEPSTLAAASLALVGLIGRRRRMRR